MTRGGLRRTSPSCRSSYGTADEVVGTIDVQFGTHFRLNSDIVRSPRGARFGLMHRSKKAAYSITRSARESNDSGMAMPSVFAVCKLTESSISVGCSTGRSAAFAPSNIFFT
jgi:hypothetical protein